MKWSFENQDSSFDLMPGPDHYKYVFTSTDTPVRHFLIPNNLQGSMFVRLRCSKLYPRLRALFWRARGQPGR